MEAKAEISQGVGVTLIKKTGKTEKYWGVNQQLTPKGCFHIDHFDKDGKLKGQYDTINGITNVGKNKILDDMFNNGTQTANNSWFIGLIDSSGYTALSSSDTMSSHGGWNEFTSYSEATRVPW